jgi:putative intracellular protease/amidase
VPHRTFRRQGVEVHVATPGGVRPTLDQVGLNPQKRGGEGMAPTSRKGRTSSRRRTENMSWKDYQ